MNMALNPLHCHITSENILLLMTWMMRIYQTKKKVLCKALENSLASYILHSADSYVGLSPLEIRQLAFEVAEANEVKMPASWTTRKCAGPDRFRGFMKRNPLLSIRVPEATSLARISGFNTHAVDKFFVNLAKVMEHHKFKPSEIYNMDETGLNTVHTPNKIVGQRGKKQIGAITSSERGEQVTLAATVSADGIALPPFFIFSRVHFYKETMLAVAPTNSAGAAYKTGWMTKELFLKYLEHFVVYSRCSKAKPVLLLLDNHSSHISLNGIKYAKENGIVLVTFPPHCSHKLQPLDRSVYGPLKTAMNKVQSEWMIANPGKTMRITHISTFVNQVYKSVFTEKNIKSGFRVSGICPFNSLIFNETDFAPNRVVHRPSDTSNEITMNTNDLDTASTSKNYVLPEKIRPVKTGNPVNDANINNRRGRTIVLTDTSETIELEEKEMNASRKRKSNNSRKAEPKKMKTQEKKINVLKDRNQEKPRRRVNEKSHRLIVIGDEENIVPKIITISKNIKVERYQIQAKADKKSSRTRKLNKKYSDYVLD